MQGHFSSLHFPDRWSGLQSGNSFLSVGQPLADRALRLLYHLLCHLLYQLTPMLFADLLELLLLLLIQQRRDFGLDFVGDLLQLFWLPLWLE
jgi:hypothetical protein